ncbi:acylneuraminate cytidylyltransferase family protein [Neptuniibacter sp. QD29_5]|uniref:acylneuraminate cytidylyltransferase family protein n=1 Tax=Neptuniibacter sp. QD29_5 TaxID=3398207 RepID=UPI0039F48CD1
MRNVCIIPARSGSKRIKNKNIRKLAGKPLVSWTIEAAQATDIFDEIIVSTDSNDVADIARHYGINVPSLRPVELSGDYTTAAEVIAYHTANVSECNICYLQPTSPLRSVDDIVNSYNLLIKEQVGAVVSVSDFTVPLNWIYDDSIDFGSFISGVGAKRSQDYDKKYVLNGAIYWVRNSLFKEFGTHLLTENIIPYVMPQDRSVDIDEEIDFKIAESILGN